MLATVISIASAVIAILSGISSARTSYQVNGSGFKASQALLTDFVTLLAAIRSIAYKAALVMGGGSKVPIPIDTELAVLRTFLTSTSGLALCLYAGKAGAIGGSDDAIAGGWRVLQINLSRLSTMTVATAEDSQQAGGLALEIEHTLSNLNAKSIKEMRDEINDLPNVLSSMAISRRDNFLLKILDEVTQEQKATHDDDFYIRQLHDIKNSGVDDPTLDLWLGVLEGDTPAVQDALANGGDQSVPLPDILEKYQSKDRDEDEVSG
jgi:hypothetical protein